MFGVVLILALAGGARAHPDQTEQITAWKSWNHQNNVSAEELGPTAARAPAPVHQRFPHAVLFGGTCGGSIIADRWILTAGHCTLFTPGRSVLAGTSNSDDSSGTRVKVKKLYLHPRFSVGPYWADADKFGIKEVAAYWDFMLAELETPLSLDGVNMAAVALDAAPVSPVAEPVSYGGFGAEHHGGLMRPDMHAMELQTITDEACSKLVQFDARSMICAEGRTARKDSACNGDSGSGLVSEGEGPRRLVGIASWVEDDARECRPGAFVVFSRVAAARPWIKQITGF